MTNSKRQVHAPSTKHRKVDITPQDECNDECPTITQWESFLPFRRLQLRTDEGVFEFTIDDVVLVLPPGYQPKDNNMKNDDFWTAKILEIRKDQPQNEIWLKVSWFYKYEDLACGVKGLRRRSFGRNERVASNHEDLIHWRTCEDVVQMKYYDESLLEHPIIDRDTYYYRYTYDYLKNIILNIPNICVLTCEKGYNPDTHEMRVCPSCACAFHITCLRKHAHASSRTLAYTAPPSKGRIVHVPPQLLALAHLPLLKGGQHGVVGNLAVVLQARTIVTEWSDQGILHWKDRLGGVSVLKVLGNVEENVSQFDCPNCGGAM